MSHNILMIAYHFPPVAASSGFLRTLKFSQYLPCFDVQPFILTVKPSAYEKISEENYKLLGEHTSDSLKRCVAKDSARDFSWRGKYFGFLAFPDRWASWIPFGIAAGLRQIKRNRVDVIWVTYPIVSALVIGYWLKKLTGLPLICDLRDPIWEEETYQNNYRSRWLKRFEKKLLSLSDWIVFTSPGTIEKYRKRYPSVIDAKSQLITNGFDSNDFPEIDVKKCGKRVFLHSGIIPIYERNPENFFVALKTLKEGGVLNAQQHEFRLRACGFEDIYRQRTKALGIDDIVSFPGSISYASAIREMQSADVLMVFQDSTCNWQIPAKVFEYMQAQRPILAWADRESDTAEILSGCDMGKYIAPLSDAGAIADVLENFIQEGGWRAKSIGHERFERRALTEKLALLVEAIVQKNQSK